MKKKLFLIVIIITTSVAMISCYKKIIGTSDKTMDSIVIDENTRKTTNSKNQIKTIFIAKTEKVDIRETEKSDIKEAKKNNSTMKTINGKIVQYSYSEIDNEDKIVQFPKLSLDGVRVGTITEEKNEEGLNKIIWENKNITGRLLSSYIGEAEARVLKNNKVYKFDSTGDLKEIKAYDI